VIDFGRVPALRSQTVWHGLTRAVLPDAGPTLSFVRPDAPYVCLGYHRDIAEVDSPWCAAQGLPVYRRMVGGGPVYLDADQLFFQISLPARRIVARRSSALADLLRPAVAALRAVGVDAELDRYGEISVGEAKVCGHGAGQVGDGVVIVGNLITGFDHDRATRILHLDGEVRGEVLRLMRRHVVATPVDPAAWQAAMVRAYSEHFGTSAAAGEMTEHERGQRDRMDALLGSAEFVAGAPRPLRAVRTVKVRAGVWVHDWQVSGRRVVLGVAGGVVETVTGDLPEQLLGLPLAAAREELARDPETAALAAAIGAANTEVAAA
jgi:lipoate-protein ligase A